MTFRTGNSEIEFFCETNGSSAAKSHLPRKTSQGDPVDPVDPLVTWRFSFERQERGPNTNSRS